MFGRLKLNTDVSPFRRWLLGIGLVGTWLLASQTLINPGQAEPLAEVAPQTETQQDTPSNGERDETADDQQDADSTKSPAPSADKQESNNENKAEKKAEKKSDVSDKVLKLFLQLLGGLGIFVLGMKNMSEGMQGVAGSSLRKMISLVTNNRLIAVAVGTAVTGFVQSSSITTVMVVGFVNSGLMQLSQAIGVIMGANIGTTFTACILTFKIGKWGLPILGASAFLYLFTKRDRLRYTALIFLGVGMVFFGLEIMKDACSFIRSTPAFEEWFHAFSAETRLGILQCMFVGCILTMIVQSSSATFGITLSLAMVGVIDFQTAAALVLGENVGTTVTALLASIGANINARRAAYFHIIFNIVGVCWAFIIFPWYVQLIPNLVNADVDRYEVVVKDGVETENYPDRPAAIAATHVIFNIANTFVLLSFVPLFARLLEKWVPGRPGDSDHHLASLDIRMLDTSTMAIEQSRAELLRMGAGCQQMMSGLREIMQQESPDEDTVEQLFQMEKSLDTIQDEVVHFLSHLLAGAVAYEVVEEGRQQLRLADELESISDYLRSILKFHLKLRNRSLRFSDDQRKGLLALHDSANKYVDLIVLGYHTPRPDLLDEAHTIGESIRSLVKQLRKDHIEEMGQHSHVSPFVSVVYTATLNSYRRIRDHAQNAAEVLSGTK